MAHDPDPALPRAHLDAYLERLGVDAEPPSVEALQRLLAAQLATVPYETVWIHHGARWTTDAHESLRRIATQRRGGYCFHLNGALALLLESLGYRVTRHIGGVHGPDGPEEAAMTNHLVLTVSDLPTDDHPQGAWYVDAGLGDGPTSALPLRAGSYDNDHYRYELAASPGGVGDWRLTHDPKGSFAGMAFRMAPADLDAFADRNVELSTSPTSGFVTTVTAQRRDGAGAHILRGCVLTRITADATTTSTVDRRSEWFDLLAAEFGLALDGVEPAAKDALWERTITGHRRWSDEQAATNTGADATGTVAP